MRVFHRSTVFITLMILVQYSTAGEECTATTLAAHYRNVISVLLNETIEAAHIIIQLRNNTSLHRNKTGNVRMKSITRTRFLNSPRDIKSLVCEILWKTKTLNITCESCNDLQMSFRALHRNTISALGKCCKSKKTVRNVKSPTVKRSKELLHKLELLWQQLTKSSG
ncbi:uncharacterized protein LOC144607146 isoform X2 [Rhinoraja longicauda]